MSRDVTFAETVEQKHIRFQALAEKFRKLTAEAEAAGPGFADDYGKLADGFEGLAQEYRGWLDSPSDR